MNNIKIMVLITLLLSNYSFSKEIHPLISLKKIYSEISENYPKDSIEFWEDNKEVKVLIIDENNRIINEIDKYKKNTKILSVFFYDVSGEGLDEIIVLTKYADKNSIYVYGIEDIYSENLWEKPYFYKFEILQNKLNKIFSNTNKLNSELVKKELNSYFPMDADGIEGLKYFQEEFKDRKINFSNAILLGYFGETGDKVSDSKNAVKYILKIDKDLCAEFYMEGHGFRLSSIYEGYEKEGKTIKNGKSVTDYEEQWVVENYKDNVLNGMANYTSYDGEYAGKYIDGKKEGQWVEGLFKGQYRNGLKEDKWINVTEGIDEYYENGNLKKWEVFDKSNKKIKKTKFFKENGDIEEYKYNDKYELKQYLLYDENNKFKEAINYTFFKNSPKESWFKSYDISKAKYIGEYFPVEKRGEILDLNSEIEKVYTTYVRGLKLFSIQENKKEIFIIMASESGYYGVKEIFEGYRKNKDISKLGDIVRNGRYELFYPNDYYSEDIENRDELIWQGHYNENKKEGTWEYYLNGIMAERKNYKEDDLNGLYQKYQWPREYLLEEGNYKNGEKIGEWKNNPSLFFFSE